MPISISPLTEELIPNVQALEEKVFSKIFTYSEGVAVKGFVAIEDNTVIGCICYYLTHNIVKVACLAVLSDYRRKVI